MPKKSSGKNFSGDRVDIRDFFKEPFTADGECVADPLAGDAPLASDRVDTIGLLISQLRELGVLGEDAELEELLARARFDLTGALNIFFDHNPAGARQRRAERRAVERLQCGADFATASSSGQAVAAKRVHAVRQKNSSGHEHRHDAGYNRDIRIQTIGQDGVPRPCGVRCVGSNGTTYEVDVLNMKQINPETGNIRDVRRTKPGVWRAQTDSRGWAFYPKEISHELEQIYWSLTSPETPGTVPDPVTEGAACGPRSFLLKALEHEEGVPAGGMSSDEIEETKCLALESAAKEPTLAVLSARLINSLTLRQGLQCVSGDARQAGLVVGSMALLRAVIVSNPSMWLAGVDMFDQKYAGLKLNVPGRKDCIRSLLARGCCLGPHAPGSKLLKKVEADSVPLWHCRCLDAIMRVYPLLSDHVRAQIEGFLT